MKTLFKLYFKVRALIQGKEVLELKSLGWWKQGGKVYNLREYYVDPKGQLYSRNGATWELNHRKGKDILICSNGTVNKSRLINTLRTIGGKKVTVSRKNIHFNLLNDNHVITLVSKTDSRKLKVWDSRYVG